MEQRQTKHFASLTEPAQIGELLRALWAYQGSPVTCAALKLAPMLFVHPGELRQAKWTDIDLEAGEWRYVTSKTKTRISFLCPHKRWQCLRNCGH